MQIPFDNDLFRVPLLIGILFMLGGFAMLKFPPRKINWFYGYRTPCAMKNQKRWDFAQKYSAKLMIKLGGLSILLSAIGFFYHPEPEVAGILGIIFLIGVPLAFVIKVETAIKRITMLFLLLTSLLSCDRPRCANTNLIFDNFSIESKEYRDELAKQVSAIGEDNLTYWFDDYAQKDNQEFIVVHIQGSHLCAKAWVLVEEWSGLSDIRKTKGLGYHGAQLVDFQMDILESPTGPDFIFRDVRWIVD